ncbi:helix-turn-helix domain-containing protein [Agromyces bauzanensis]|uniref:Insertion element IS150 protein InsJ-like helix-turn-helix domain-containing protein n=1 Tax=Agromyces bauzanensis TaxID=1308924 RepID=A0A917UXF2_9MICO|nr:helix-turn-helix domain-containing protein [Agromyces bauzanensis]GGJ92475.1 hypothetical protein GCM10011372_33730 [Agromyces bauzanensis]
MAIRNQNRVIVLSIVNGGLSVTEAAARIGVGRQWVHVLLARYREHGEAGLEPHSRRPRSSPAMTDEKTRAGSSPA